MIVLDSSAAVDLVLRTPRAPWVEEYVAPARRVAAPHVLDVEVASALRRAVRVGDISEERELLALANLVALQIERFPHPPLLARVWELRDNLTVADAVFVALAEFLEAALVTTDAALARAPGHRATIVAP